MSGDNPFGVSPSAFGDRSPSDRDVMVAQVTTRTVEMLSQTRPWVQFIGILMWIGTVLMAIAGASMILLALLGGNANPAFIGMGVGYGIGALIYGAFASALTGYASCINRLKSSENVRDLEDALESQKKFWRLAGIITLVVLIIYLLILVFVFVGGALMVGAMRG